MNMKATMPSPVHVKRCRVLPPAVALLLCLGGYGVCAAQADGGADRPEGKGQKWAMLIGIEKYHRAPQLHYTVHDVQLLAETLRSHGDYPEENILEIVDTAPNPRWQPLRASVMAELTKFLARPGPEDEILVYFSGHGFRDKDGKLYLAPIDCDPDNPGPTGVAVEWFREKLAGCKAGTKLLVLDACHAGSEKGEEDKGSVASKDIGSLFKDMTGVVTLASSTSDEKSLIWEERQQSLFSYWLNQGLKGHADSDSDGAVTIDELYAYVYRNVTHTAKTRFPKGQTPVRIVRAGTLGVPVVIRLKPQSVKQVLTDVSEQLALAMEDRKLSKVGVLEFTNDTKLGELLGADFGLLGRYCAEELERRLMAMGADKFNVVDRRRLQKAIQERGFALDDLASTDALRQLSQRAGGMPVIALGTLRNRMGRVVALQCKLIQTDRDELAGTAGGSAVLNESEWAMLGRSVHVRPEDRRPDAPGPDRPTRPVEDLVVERLDRRSQGTHPLLDPSFPYRVKIMVQQAGRRLPVERKGVFRGNDMFVPLRKGEVYEIWVENNSSQMVMMRLLVDGLNTLPEPERTKAMIVEEKPGKRPMLPAQRVNLDEAKHWILDPAQGKLVAVRGFFSSTGKAAQYHQFKVVDAQDSLAARQKFTEQIGLITAAFYAPKSGSRSVGTGFGAERTEVVEEQKGTECGNLLAVVHIRYVEPETLQSAQR